MIPLDAHRQPIAALAGSEPRPLWSVMIPTYNCGPYLRGALESVLAQDPGAELMQIEVVDDHSPGDDSRALVAELGCGRVGFHRHVANLGHIANFNSCIERATGRLVHILHGDDAVRPGFYRAMRRPFDDHPEIGAAFCRYISMDARGHWETIAPLEQPAPGILEGWLERIALGQRLQPPCIVVRREVYERLGGYDSRLTSCEDWEMWVRIAASYPVWYEPEPLALYRAQPAGSGAANISSDELRTGRLVRQLRQVIELNRDILPPDRVDQISARALEITATTALRRAGRMARAGDAAGARAQLREALRTSRSPAVLERAAVLMAVWARASLGRALTKDSR